MLADVHACVEAIFGHIGASAALRLATPLGLGKPNVLLNAIYRRVAADPALKLDIYTALSLARPQPKSDLERRFLEPFLVRHFGADYPDLDYVAAQHANALPTNIRVHEFYLQSGTMLGVGQSQRDYTSLNYTHVARDLVRVGINVVVQLIAVREEQGRVRYSLACNPDVSLDLIERMAAVGALRPLVVGVVHPQLPFVGNEAEVGADQFDIVLRDEACAHTLFALPRAPVDTAEFAIGLHASTLVRDGGTLQLGIGALSDALVHAMLLRRAHNDDYRGAVGALGNRIVPGCGGLDSFAQGLYGASEMLMDGFMHLARAGILARCVYADEGIERALADGIIGRTLPGDAADRLHTCGVLPTLIDARELARLQRFGFLPQGTQLLHATLLLPDGGTLSTDLRSESARAAWNRVLAGRSLRDGRYLRGAFYLGSVEFYAWLRGLQGAEFEGLSMTQVSDINQLYGGREALDSLQRRHARFFNACMMATALGAAVSDTLDTGQVVSGVGGQYNFVAMAHALDDGRSILMLRSWREHHGAVKSNILWNYGQATIPRHLRDIYVTEYGIADLRGKSDEDCIIAMLAIADARFQHEIVAQAKANGKLAADFTVPASWHDNAPERLATALAPLCTQGRFPRFPFGSDFNAEEQALLPALKRLQRVSTSKPRLAAFLLASLWQRRVLAEPEVLLRRLALQQPRSLYERLLRRLVLHALNQRA